jgi:hypothetical protein
MTAGFDETLAYLQARYLTPEQLAEAAGLTVARVDELIEAGLAPPHTHLARFALTVSAPINGVHEVEPRTVRYFHPDKAAIVRQADALAREVGVQAAAETLRQRHDLAVAEEAGLEVGSEAHRALSDRAWAAWRQGTHGVCLQRVAPQTMIRKVLATARLEAALASADAGRPVDRDDLADALDRYASVAGPFGPHELAGSTRARIYEPARALLLTLEVGEQAARQQRS